MYAPSVAVGLAVSDVDPVNAAAVKTAVMRADDVWDVVAVDGNEPCDNT